MILHCLARIQIQSLLERIHISNLCGLQFAKSPVHNIKHGLTAIKYFYYFPLTTKRNPWYETVGSKWKSVLATDENSHLATSRNFKFFVWSKFQKFNWFGFVFAPACWRHPQHSWSPSWNALPWSSPQMPTAQGGRSCASPRAALAGKFGLRRKC